MNKKNSKPKSYHSVETPRQSGMNKGTLVIESEAELKNYYRLDEPAKSTDAPLNLTDEMKELHYVIHQLTPEKRIAKAVRHFRDALYLRKVRNDLDGKIL